MKVGINYPWLDYGWDFGLGPSAWRGERSTPRWYDCIDEHLRHFSDLGISVVRWFILADGLTYGTGEAAPRRDSTIRRGWRFDPPPLSAERLQHFEVLIERFADASATRPIQLLPVLIDFHFCQRGILPIGRASAGDERWVKQGRADAVIDPIKRTRFFDEVLEPLLRASQRHPDVIHAWELINEPEWVTRGWHPKPLRHLPVREDAMRAFIDEGQQRIRRAGFRSTVGFAFGHTIRTTGITADINQFHHYPGGRLAFDPTVAGVGTHAILGEFATDPADVWPDLNGTGQRVGDRLRLARERGCALAMPWSFLSRDRHSRWSPDVEDEIRQFTAQLPTPRVSD